MQPADWSIILGLVAITAVDVLFIVYRSPTISNRFRMIGRKVSFFPYAWGALGGHFWGPPMQPAFGNWWASIGILLGVGVLLSLAHFLVLLYSKPPPWVSLLYIPCGIPLGMFFWPQQW
jgi:hypothetical protein